MVVLENGLLLDGVLYAVLDLIRRLFRFEVHQTSGVLSVFEDMNDGVGRPFALIAWVITAGAACPLNLPYYIPLLPSITSDCCRLDYYVSFLSKMV